MIAVLVDASIIRSVLVPATMQVQHLHFKPRSTQTADLRQ